MSIIQWSRTLWSEARQATALNDWPAMVGDDQPPADFFHALRAEGRDQEAALFLAQSLSRYDAVAWAAGIVSHIPPARLPGSQAAIMAVDAWLADATERTRQAAGEAAGPIDPPSAPTLCALAVFYSGGTIAPLDQPVVVPDRGATGRFAGAAVITAVSLADDPTDALNYALDTGEQMARGMTENRQ